MNRESTPPSVLETPTRVRYGVLGFACSLAMITYLDRVCFGTVAPFVQAEFGLSDSEKGLLFTAFALAYAAFEVPTGWLGDIFGPRKTLIRIVIWWSVFTAMTGLIYPRMFGSAHLFGLPLAFLALLAVRFFFGIGEAGAFPNISRAFYSWFPLRERGSAQGAVWMAGRFAGGITSWIVLALVFETTTATGQKLVWWRHIFWGFGAMGVVWCVWFYVWFRDRPEQKASVNQAEIDLIRGGDPPHGASHSGVPWGLLLKSTNLWALCLMYACAAYGWYFNITWLPGYLRDQYGVTKESWGLVLTGFLYGSPLLFGSLACLTGGLMTDWFIRKTGNRKWGRRLFGVVGHSICAFCYFLSIYAADPVLFVFGITMATFWNDMTMGSAWASCIDIGKRYSGIVSGCMNTVGNLGGAAAGYMTGWILDLHAQPVRAEVATDLAATVGNGFPLSGGFGPVIVGLGNVAESAGRLMPATHAGWKVNFIIFSAVYVAATLFWLRFDSTQPVVPEEGAVGEEQVEAKPGSDA